MPRRPADLSLSLLDTLFGTFGAVIVLFVIFATLQGEEKPAVRPWDFAALNIEITAADSGAKSAVECNDKLRDLPIGLRLVSPAQPPHTRFDRIWYTGAGIATEGTPTLGPVDSTTWSVFHDHQGACDSPACPQPGAYARLMVRDLPPGDYRMLVVTLNKTWLLRNALEFNGCVVTKRSEIILPSGVEGNKLPLPLDINDILKRRGQVLFEHPFTVLKEVERAS